MLGAVPLALRARLTHTDTKNADTLTRSAARRSRSTCRRTTATTTRTTSSTSHTATVASSLELLFPTLFYPLQLRIRYCYLSPTCSYLLQLLTVASAFLARGSSPGEHPEIGSETSSKPNRAFFFFSPSFPGRLTFVANGVVPSRCRGHGIHCMMFARVRRRWK